MLYIYDIQHMLRDIDHADSVGPLLDPTLWMKKGQQMREDREILKAALPLWNMAKKAQKKAKTTPSTPAPSAEPSPPACRSDEPVL